MSDVPMYRVHGGPLDGQMRPRTWSGYEAWEYHVLLYWPLVGGWYWQHGGKSYIGQEAL